MKNLVLDQIWRAIRVPRFNWVPIAPLNGEIVFARVREQPKSRKLYRDS